MTIPYAARDLLATSPLHVHACNADMCQCGCQAIARQYGGRLTRTQATELLQAQSPAGGGREAEQCDVLWSEMGLPEHAALTKVCSQPLADADACRKPSTLPVPTAMHLRWTADGADGHDARFASTLKLTHYGSITSGVTIGR